MASPRAIFKAKSTYVHDASNCDVGCRWSRARSVSSKFAGVARGSGCTRSRAYFAVTRVLQRLPAIASTGFAVSMPVASCSTTGCKRWRCRHHRRRHRPTLNLRWRNSASTPASSPPPFSLHLLPRSRHSTSHVIPLLLPGQIKPFPILLRACRSEPLSPVISFATF